MMEGFFKQWSRGILGILTWIGLSLGVGTDSSLAAEIRLEATQSTPGGPIHLNGTGITNASYRLERSTNLQEWQEWLRLIPNNGSFHVQDGQVSESNSTFYRFGSSTLTSIDDWKNQATIPNDPFMTLGEGGDIFWIKFLILTNDPTRVYFQNSSKYVLHHDFARVRIPQFSGISRVAFDEVTLHLTNQQAVLGSVMVPVRTNLNEVGIQFAGQEPYAPEWIAKYFHAVRSALDIPAATQVFYFPAYEQTEAAQTAEPTLKAQGVSLGSVFRWVNGDQVYSPGWALGRFRYIAATNISAAYTSGQLRPTDILLTDGIPAELPFVAGIISLTPATPNSHVAIFAGANSIPFAYVQETTRQEQLRQLDGREVILRCSVRYGYNQITVADVQGQLDDAARVELLKLKTPPPVNLLPKQHLGQLSINADVLQLKDRAYFGGKAANYGILRRMAPNNSEPGIAFSFDLWDAFMDQTLPGGISLRDTIRTHLSGVTNYPPEMSAVQTHLAAIRDLITGVASFNAEQRQAITNALSLFDPTRKIRFRSSSNAEDSKSYVGAGLYDSFSGCLLDDLDTDESGPCQCDATESKEKGVFRAIQKVYASFYNDNAFLERLRHGMDESQVAMGVLVHYSAPDTVEIANGVAQMYYVLPKFFGPRQLVGDFVTQWGAVSITNPDGSAVPEVARVTEFGLEILRQHSSLVPMGSTVLKSPSDYTALFSLMQKVYSHYSTVSGNTTAAGPLLDFEFKKIQPGKLMLKQVRELPQESTTQADPFLVNEPTTYWVFNSEQSSVMADHRLKCFLTLQTGNQRLDTASLDTCFYKDGIFEYRLGDTAETLSGSPTTWPNASHSVTQTSFGRTVQDRWTVGTGTHQRTYVLNTVVPLVAANESLVVTSRDLRKWLEVTYATAQPNPEGAKLTTESVRLVMAPDPATLAPGTTETFQAGKYAITISFLVSKAAVDGPPLTVDPNPYGSFPAYYPSWAQTTITGLLPDPIVLKGYYASTGTLGHQRRFQWFVLEPATDPTLPLEQRQALEAADIRLIYIYREPYTNLTRIQVLGANGIFRSL